MYTNGVTLKNDKYNLTVAGSTVNLVCFYIHTEKDQTEKRSQTQITYKKTENSYNSDANERNI